MAGCEEIFREPIEMWETAKASKKETKFFGVFGVLALNPLLHGAGALPARSSVGGSA
jgi:hypothetical protein